MSTDRFTIDEYATAGQFFGELRRNLSFGELNMIVDVDERMVVYELRWTAEKEAFRVAHTVPLRVLAAARYPSSLAVSVASDWKASARLQSPPNQDAG